MRSLYVGILLAMVTILALAFLASTLISGVLIRNYYDPVFDVMDEFQLQDARSHLEERGPSRLKEYLSRLDSLFGGSHYLLDASGTDVLSGTDRSDLLPRPPVSKWRGRSHGQYLVTHRSEDGRYWFVATGPLQSRGAPFYPYYLLVVAASAALCWLAAVRVVSPLRKIAGTVAQFGKGNLSVRLQSSRKDEIGMLARSFDGMADRIEALLVSERRLLEDVSHELRSPLARLSFSVKLARTATDREAALDRVKRDVDRLSVLVTQLVEMTRAEAESNTGRSEIVFLNDVVTDTVQDCSLEAEAHGCTIQVNGELTAQTTGDRELLRRAIENVLRNAIRHSPENATIDVALQENPREAVIAVRDYGSGVPEESLARIFDPFFRVEEARDAETGGVGLGLSIARRAI
ncbi:MAG TPA: ATP-binding protein, partial [Terriglobales bacterium]|nr:ATP-binding protein [Terriglobales bacterium]